MAKSRKNNREMESKRAEREGAHGERLNETQIDTEVSNRSMKGEQPISEDEVNEAFGSDRNGRGANSDQSSDLDR